MYDNLYKIKSRKYHKNGMSVYIYRFNWFKQEFPLACEKTGCLRILYDDLNILDCGHFNYTEIKRDCSVGVDSMKCFFFNLGL